MSSAAVALLIFFVKSKIQRDKITKPTAKIKGEILGNSAVSAPPKKKVRKKKQALLNAYLPHSFFVFSLGKAIIKSKKPTANFNK